MWRKLVLIGLLAAGVMTVGQVTAAPQAPPSTIVAAQDPLVRAIGQAQERLHRVPGDWSTWSALGTAYVERARVTADPTYYAKAEQALHESLRLNASANPAALTGLGALANARHDFEQARTLAQQALSLNPYSADAYGVLVDAETQLGNSAQATEAVQHMLDLRPELPALSRAAYDLELHDNLRGAIELWSHALTLAYSPADVAGVHEQLGNLALRLSDLDSAASEFRQAGSLHGLARVDAARGDLPAALARYRELTLARPSPALLTEYAVLLQHAGRVSEATTQLDLADAALKLSQANGTVDNLASAEIALARGDYPTALAYAEREWQRRHHPDVASVLARAQAGAA